MILVCVCVVLLCTVGAAFAQTIHGITDRGVIFEIESSSRAPTTDIVSSPYADFQRLGGLVANGGTVYEAGRYNPVGTGDTYIISDWGRGNTVGLPNGAPLKGQMRLDPVPHMYLSVPQPVGGAYWPGGISHIDMVSGTLTHTMHNHTTYLEYHRFEGSGRAIIWLDVIHGNYSVNMVCVQCQTDTPAVLGNIPVVGGIQISNENGTVSSSPRFSTSCMVDGILHAGCGTYWTPPHARDWPLDPRPDLPDMLSHIPNENGPVLHITKYDTISCPGAGHNNTGMVYLDDMYFQMESSGCIMENYDYVWWDGTIALRDTLPLRAGTSEWDRTHTSMVPVIILDMRGGEILIQSYAAPTRADAEAAFHDTFDVDTGTMSPDSIIILHDAFSHLGMFTVSTISGMDDYIMTYPQIPVDHTVSYLAHNRAPGAEGTGGLLGADCTTGYKYCITIFDGAALPVVNNAADAIYDTRNHVVLNRGGIVHNHASVFSNAGTPATVPYKASHLNLIQSYGVIPVIGATRVTDLYLMYGFPSGCDTYVDTTTDPPSWTGGAHPGWLRLTHLEGDYTGANPLIQVPLLPGYDTVCMRMHGSDNFRQFNMDDFFAQGSHASLGGIRYISTDRGPLLTPDPDWFDIHVLDTDVTLPGTGTRVMDLTVDLSGTITITGVVPGGGGATGTQPNSCDWHTLAPPVYDAPRHTPHQRVVMSVSVNVQAPVDGAYQTVGGLSASEISTLSAPRPPVTVGGDCMHVSYAEFDFDPEYRTIPVTLGPNTPVLINIKTSVNFANGAAPVYAGSTPAETMHVETILDKLLVGVQ